MRNISPLRFFSRLSKLGCFLLALLVSGAHAGVTINLQLYHNGDGDYYLMFANLATNGLTPVPTNTLFYVWSPDGSTNTDVYYEMDSTGASSFNGGNYYGTFDDLLQDLTNSWTFMTVQGGVSNVYQFTFSGITSNQFPYVAVLYPTNGSVDVPQSPLFYWTLGPTNYSELYVQVNDPDYNQDFNADLPLTQTNWQCPGNLAYGSNFDFTVIYNNFSSGITATTPSDASSNAFPGWSSTAQLTTYNDSSFQVAGAPTTISNYSNPYGHTLIAHYTFDATNNLGNDSSGFGNYLNCGSGWGPNPTLSTTDAVAGGEALQFFGNTSIGTCGQIDTMTNLTNAFAGSFSVSAWLKTTNIVGGDSDGLSDCSDQNVIYLDNNANGCIPLGLTGTKAAFFTGAGGGDTLNSSNSVVTGSYTHVVVTRDKNSGQKSIYINGVLDTTDFGAAGLLDGGADYFSIGGEFCSAYTGIIDDVQIYQGVLAPGDVMQLYQNPGATVSNASFGDLAAHYDFDEGTPLALDVSGDGNNMLFAGNFGGNGPVITNQAEAGAGAVYFDSGSFLTPPPTLLPTLAGSFSVSLWLNTTQNYDYQGDYAINGAGVVSAGLEQLANDVIPIALTGGQVAFNVGDTTDGYDDTLNSVGTVNDGNWHHVVVTRDQPSGERQIYIDGALDSDETSTTNLLSDPKSITVGALADAYNPDPTSPSYTGHNGYQGILDDLQLYTRALTSDEVAFLYTHPGSTLVNANTNGLLAFNFALNTTNLNWTTSGNSPWVTETNVSLDGAAAESGSTTNGQTSVLQTVLTGPGSVSFSWEMLNDDNSGLDDEFDIDGNYQNDIGYTTSWQRAGPYYFGPGTHALSWTASGDVTADPNAAAYLDEVAIGDQYPPFITLGPINATNLTTIYYQYTEPSGSAFAFLCQYTANPAATLQWYSNDAPIPGATNATLTFTNLQLSQSGYYYMTASNSLGVATSPSVELIVYQSTDLIPLSFSYPTNVSSDTRFTMIWTVTNTGPGSVSNFYDNILFSPPLASELYYYVNFQTVGASTYTITNTITFPNLSAGNYMLTLDVDGNQAVVENSYSNNFLAGPPLTVVNPDMQPGNLQVSMVTNLGGGGLTVLFNTTNNGPGILDGSVYWRDTIYLSTNPVIDSNTVTVSSFLVNTPIGAGQFVTTTNSFTLPAEPSGSYYLLVDVNSTGNILEGNTSNNVVMTQIQFLEPDLVCTNLTAPAVADTQQNIALQWVDYNQGNGVAQTQYLNDSAEWYDSIYVSSKSNLDNTAILIDTTPVANILQPGQSLTNTNNALNIYVPGVPPGNYYILVDVNAFGDVAEYDRSNNVFAKPVQIVAPDLVPLSLNAPSAASDHSSFAVSWTVANQGNGAAGGGSGIEWLDALFISTKTNLDNTATFLCNAFLYGPIAAGSNYTVNASVSIPALAAGNYYLLVQADAYPGSTGFYESNTNNNLLAAAISIGAPDLAAVSLTVATNLTSQEPINPYYVVSNVAGVTALPGWADALYLTTNGIFDSNSISIDGMFTINSALPVGGVYTNIVDVSVPGVPAGNYTILLYADASHYFDEPTFANNFVTQPVSIINPDLVASNFNAPASVTITQINQLVQADWSAFNRGPGAAYAAWADYVYISRTNVLDSNAVPIGVDNISPVLAVGESYNGFANLTVPNFVSGNFYLILNVNDGNALFETTHTNNTLVRPFQIDIAPVPILSVTSVSAPSSAWSGTEIEVSWVLTNSGPGTVNGPFYNTVFLATDASGDGAQDYGNFEFTGEIPPYQSVVQNALISLPINLSGTFWVGVAADVNQQVFQYTNRPNETLIASHPTVVNLTPTPDLSIAAIQAPTNVFSSAEVTVSWIETNSGAGPTRVQYWYDSVFLSASTNMYDPHYFLYLGSAGNASYLAPGGSYSNSTTVTIPQGLEGTYYFLVQADTGNNVFELDKTNNVSASAPVFVNLTPTPDLQVTSVVPPQSAFSGQAVAVRWAVTNFGLGQTPPTQTNWYDGVYISTNQMLDASAIFLGDLEHSGGLDPGEGYSATGNFYLPIGISGQYYFIIYCDYENNVFEGAFADDKITTASFATTINLTPPPDLATTIDSSPTNALASHLFTVGYTVANIGATATPNTSWADALYFSTNATFNTSNATVMARTEYNGGQLQAGRYYSNNLSLTLPDMLTGTFYVFVYSDYYDEVFELDKSNNLAAAAQPVTIISRPADLVPISLVSPPTANAASTVLVGWTVTNIGSGDTAVTTWDDSVVLSPYTVPGSSSDVTLVTVQHTGLIDANGSYTVTNQVATIPGSINPGIYYLFVIADSGNSVYEGTNHGNDIYGPVSIAISFNSAELQVVSATAPTNGFACSNVTVQYTVTNSGNLSPNTQSWYDVIYLTSDGVVDLNSSLVGFINISTNLPPGAAYTNSVSVPLPVTVQSNYSFVVVVDAGENVAEAFRDPDYIITPPINIALCAFPDLMVTNIMAPAAAYEGQPITLTWTVQNIGSNTAFNVEQAYDAAYLSLDQVFDPLTAIYLGYAYSPSNTLAPGQSYTNTASFPIPEGLSGPYYAFISANFDHAVNENGAYENNVGYGLNAVQVQLLPPVNLVAGVITIPVNATSGQSMTITYNVQNQGSNAALGSWDDALFISSTTNYTVGDPLFATAQHTGDVAPGFGYTNTVTAPLPGLVPGNYYVIISSDILNHLGEGNNPNKIAASLNSVDITVPQLTMGTPSTGTINGGQSAFYSFNATNGETVFLQLTTGAPLGDNELFVKYGQMPTSASFDFAANDPFVADPQLFMPLTNTGTYYVLAYSEYLPSAMNYSILAQVLPFSVQNVQPPTAGDVGQTTFEVEGALFDTNTEFQLYDGTDYIFATGVLLENSSLAYVTFPLSGAPDGTYEMMASIGPSNQVISVLSNAVTIVPGSGPVADVSINGPLQVDANSRLIHQVTIIYGNSGDADLATPLIWVDSGGAGTALGFANNVLSTNPIQMLGRSLTGPTNLIMPQAEDSFLIFCATPYQVDAYAFTADSTVPISDSDWTNIQASVRPAGISDANWAAFWGNIQPRVGTNWGSYVQFVQSMAQNFPVQTRSVSSMVAYMYSNTPNFQASSSLSGVVLGATNNLPQTNVEVDVIPYSTNSLPSPTASVYTDSNGRFFFPSLPAGQYVYAVLSSDGVSQLDMNQDGIPDTNSVIVTIPSTGDVSNQTLYLYQAPSIVGVTDDSDAVLVLDSQNVLHNFWYRNGGLWHSWLNGGNWVDAAMITPNTYDFISAAAGPTLLDGTSPGIIVVWTQVLTNGNQLFYAVGRPSNPGFEWSQPVQLTFDNGVESFNPSVVVQNNGTAVISYLKLSLTYQDDTDVYYSTVNPSSAALFGNSGQGNSVLIADTHLSLAPAPRVGPLGNGISIGPFSKNFDCPINSEWDFKIGVNAQASGSVNECTAGVSGTAGLGLTFTSPQYIVTGEGSVGCGANWQIDPDQCNFVFKNCTLQASGSIGVTLRDVVSSVLHSDPETVVIAGRYDSFVEWAARHGVKIENTMGTKIGVLLNGVSWDHDVAPYLQWRMPDNLGITRVFVQENIGIGVRTRGLGEEVVTTETYGTNGITSYSSIVASAKSGPFGNLYIGATGAGSIQLTFSIYPSIRLQNITGTGSIKLNIGSSFSYTLPLDITANPIIIGDQAKPRGGGSDPLPDGWSFGYTPANDVGTTNVYGSNAVLSTVSSDTFEDGAPSLAIDSTGIPFQVWCKAGDPTAAHMGSQIYVADFNGVNWNAPVVISNSLGWNSEVYCANDSLGNRLAVWSHIDTSNLSSNSTYDDVQNAEFSADMYYSTCNGSTWSTPQLLASTPGPDKNLQLSYGAKGDVIAVWTYFDTNSINHLLTSTWNGNTWTTPYEIANGNLGSPSAQQVNGTTIVFWTQFLDTNYDTCLYQSSNTGGGWSTPVLFSPAVLTSTDSVRQAAPQVTSQPRDIYAGLANLSNISLNQYVTCCKCQGHITNIYIGKPCGYATVTYDYLHCRRIFTYRPCAVDGTDPNNIIGPVGFGPEHWVSSTSPLAYTIDCYNDPSLATGPAQVVSITAPLDPNFNPSSFRLGNFGFGGMTYNPPSNSAFFETNIDLTATSGFIVNVAAGVNVVQDQAFWTFTTIDPNTGNVPLNPQLGFLPPDTNAPNGEAFVNFSVLPFASVTNGTQVSEQANIVFDNQPPVPTDIAYNVLEVGTPASYVVPLPSATVNPTFTVSWLGQSVLGGNGIASYDIYVSQNNSAYFEWLQGTALQSSTYIGTPGNTYSFYSIAHDNSGNVQPTPSLPNTTIYISTNLPPVIIQPTNIVVVPDSIALEQIMATDPNGAQITFSITSSPTNACITTNGMFSWPPGRAFASTTNVITVVATDNGTPPLSTNATFEVIVLDYLDLALGMTNVQSGETSFIPIVVSSSDGVTNLTFTTKVPETLLTNLSVQSTNPAVNSATLQNNTTNFVISLATGPGTYLTAMQQAAQLNFKEAGISQTSALVPLPILSITAYKPSGLAYSNYVTHEGQLVVVDGQPVLRATIDPELGRDLQLFGWLGTNYELQFMTNSQPPVTWTPLLDYTQTNGVLNLSVDSSNAIIYYRIIQK